MVKFIILFLKPVDASAFEDSYTQLLALVEQMPDITRRQVVHVHGGPTGYPPYHRILELYFEDMPTLIGSLKAPAGQQAGAALNDLFQPRSFEALYAEVYEEAGGRTEG